MMFFWMAVWGISTTLVADIVHRARDGYVVVSAVWLYIVLTAYLILKYAVLPGD